VGPAAIPKSYCSLDAGEPAGWRVAATYGWLASTLDFADGPRVDFSERMVLAAASRQLGGGFTVQLGAGAVLGGSFDAPGTPAEVLPGPLAQVQASWLALEGRGAAPFLAFTAGLSGSWTHTRSASGEAALTALDLSLSASVGKAIAGVVAPYLGAKVFGGPVYWTWAGGAVTGTDAYHYQVGIGLAAALPGGLDLVVEGSPLGERSATASVGWAF
jgi:hypothetical protein